MSIPLDRLYHYIEDVAQEVHGDSVLIYRFFPHGSKKIEDLSFLSNSRVTFESLTRMPPLYCYDQEPLDYNRYVNSPMSEPELNEGFNNPAFEWPDYNLRTRVTNIYDYSILVHSEKRSSEVEKYQSNFFIPVYYWSHAIIARDWFRYAEHQSQHKKTDLKDFLIYNRAWSGTREYRIKFTDLLVEHDLVDQCKTSFNTVEPEIKINYQQHKFLNSNWIPKNILENHFKPTVANASYSADFDINDYNSTRFEVVLETLFDDDRLHLTEKSLRPIACGQPFILAGTWGSLEYIRSYGFQTFDGIIDESYDLIKDPGRRLTAIVQEMRRISNWTDQEKQHNLIKLQQIAQHNRRHFFSDEFSLQIVNELQQNLKTAFDTLENKNTSKNYFAMRKKLNSIPALRQKLLIGDEFRSRQQILATVKKAREYYNKSPNKY